MRYLTPVLFIVFFATHLQASAEVDSSCAKVTGMYVSAVTTSSATLEWDDVPKSNGYQYVVSKSSVAPDKFGFFIKEPRHTETGLAAGATYYAHVRTSCEGSTTSGWVTVQFNTPVLPKDRNLPLYVFAVQAYPSTAEWSVTVKVKDSEEDTAAVTLYNMLGKKIKEYPLTGDRLHIEVGGLPPSIYYIRYNDARGRIQTMRFTKI